MPYTKRLVVHDGQKGLSACLNYCTDEKKTDGGLLLKGVNCNAHYAVREFMSNIEKYHTQDTERVAYHIIQSFDFRDKITPEKVNEIGIKLCKDIYPEYQCVVCTHIDKGHLHNHIIVNATSLTGKKLDDRLSNRIEGLYGLRASSDRLGKEYGCHVMEEFKPIGKYKSKKNYVYDVANESWRSVIKTKIDELKIECQSFEELLERLSLEGYIIKNGKYISVKPYGAVRFTRLKTIDDEYSEQSLRKFFKQKKSEKFIFKDYKIINNQSPLLCDADRMAKYSKQAVLLSSTGQKKGKDYPKYFNSRYKEIRRYESLVKSINFMNEEEIYHYEELAEKLDTLKAEIEIKETEYLKQKSLNHTMLAELPVAKICIENYQSFRNYQEQVRLFGNDVIQLPDEVKLYLDAIHELGDKDISEIRDFVAECTKVKIETNKQYAYLSYLKKRYDDLEKLRMKSMEDSGYIKSLSFTKKMIDNQRSNDKTYCVRLPYTRYYVYLPISAIAWNHYDERATMFLIDDEKYDLYNEENEKVGEVNGDEVAMLSKSEKDRLYEYYSKV